MQKSLQIWCRANSLIGTTFIIFDSAFFNNFFFFLILFNFSENYLKFSRQIALHDVVQQKKKLKLKNEMKCWHFNC